MDEILKLHGACIVMKRRGNYSKYRAFCSQKYKLFQLYQPLTNECRHTRDIINILKKSNAAIQAAWRDILGNLLISIKSNKAILIMHFFSLWK